MEATASTARKALVPEWQSLEFTGTGKEYFRIWIVNLCLSMATLGIYSAWAKVRRLQYFDRNTTLGGAVFNFHGEPKIILRGRIVAILLLFCYHYLFTLSGKLALTFFAVFLLGIPFLMRSALRFRLQQTSYRGLRFQFHGSVKDAYSVYFPVAFVFLLPGLVGVLYPHKPEWVTLAFAAYLMWPWLHARMRIYQHGNIGFGQMRSRCDMTGGAFGWSYVGVFLALLCVVVFIFFAIGITESVVQKHAPDLFLYFRDNRLIMFLAIVSTLMMILIGLASVSYIQVTAWNKAWYATSFPGMDIDSSIPYWPFWRLQLKNVFATVFSAGLYRPFAIVALYKFRLKYIRVRSTALDDVRALQLKERSQAAGDSSADMFGFDLSW